jgi:Fe-S-cluster containining protein
MLENKLNILNNENTSLCKKCGRCCNHYAGIVHPSQLPEITVKVLKQMFKDGYCFDNYVGNPTDNPEYDDLTAWFIRPQHTNKIGQLIDESYGGKCSFLTDTGCKLTFENRPAGCQDLIPGVTKCVNTKGYDKASASANWLPYNKIIEQFIKDNET